MRSPWKSRGVTVVVTACSVGVLIANPIDDGSFDHARQAGAVPVNANEPVVIFEGLGSLGLPGSLATDISPDGLWVVGVANSPAGPQAFRYSASTGMIGLGDLPGGAFASVATGISTNGTVVVGWSSSENGTEEAFRWTNAEGMVGLGDFEAGPFGSQATSISSNGSVIAGFGTIGPESIEAFRWTLDSGLVGLGDLPGGTFASRGMAVSGDGNVITGWGNSGIVGVSEAFRWTPVGGMTGLGFIPDAFLQGTQAQDISFNGKVIVGSGWATLGVEAFMWISEIGYFTLGDLPGGGAQPFSTAFAVSADGRTVVGSGTTDLIFDGITSEAFIWTAGGGIRNLKTVLESEFGAPLEGWHLLQGRGVSVTGKEIVGVGKHNGVDEAWIARLVHPPCPADLNGDGVVNMQDLMAFFSIPLGLCFDCDNCSGDVNGDCVVNFADLDALIGEFGDCP